jgi:predicted dehydrogenase
MDKTSQKYTASVVGGGLGGKLSLRALAKSPYFELVAACDLRPEVCQELQREFPGLQTFLSYQEMFERCPTELVCVSVLPPGHEEITLAALAQLPLKAILVEKPLGHTTAAGQNILKAVKAKKLPLAVPHNLLAKKTPLEIIERVKGGEIGELKLVEIESTRWDILNAGIHWINFFVVLTGNAPVEFVLAGADSSTRTYRDGLQVETMAVTFAQNSQGVRLVMQTGDQVKVSRAGKMSVFRLIGSAGQIEFWGWENGYYLQNAEYGAGKIIVPQEFEVIEHRRHLENLILMIEQQAPDYRLAESSLAALEICEAAYLSCKYQCLVKLPLSAFQPPAPSGWQLGQPYTGEGGGRDGRKWAEF